MRSRILLSLTVAALVGCQGLPTGTNKPNAIKRSPKPGVESPGPDASTAPVIGASQAPTGLLPTGETRLVDPSKLSADLIHQVNLIGKVKLISDKGLGVISNNAGNLVSNNGGGLISDKGLGLVSNGGANYRALAAAAENLLADAVIEVLDAQGRVLVGPDGKAITAVTDQEGSYALKTTLPNENLILRVKLFPNGGAAGAGGELQAIMTRDRVGGAGGTSALPIDTASTLGAAYVLDKYVQKRADVLNLLPAVEADALARDMELARTHLPTTPPTYKPADMVVAAEELRKKEPKLGETIERIRALLLGGQSNLGNGLKATAVPLAGPVAITDDGQGGLLIGEAFMGRVRRVSKDGLISNYPDPKAAATVFGLMHHIQRGPKGELYIAAFRQGKVLRLDPDGKLTTLAGTGKTAPGAVDVKGTATTLNNPAGVALAPDGSLYISEAPETGAFRLLKLEPDGMLRQIPNDPNWSDYANLHSVAVAGDGTVFVYDTNKSQISKRTPDGQWTTLADNLLTETYSRLALGPDGKLYFTEGDGHRIRRISVEGGTPEHVAGTGINGFSGDGGPATTAQLSDPAGLHFGPDGTLYVADMGNGMVRAIGKDGIIRTVAGTQGVTQVGDALSVAINQPGGLAIDAQGRVIVSEIGSSVIKRLEGDKLVAIAGTTRGYAGDGGPATAAKFNSMLALAFKDDSLFLLDNGNLALRKIDGAGIVTTVVGNGSSGPNEILTTNVLPADSNIFRLPAGLAVAPDGMPVWADNGNHWIWKLRPDGQIEKIAGGGHHSQSGYSGDGGDAVNARLNSPVALAYDKVGNLYVTDAANMCIRRITPAGKIELFAGIPGDAGLQKLLANAPTVEGALAKESLIVGPGPLCFGPDGNMYVMEMGTINLAAFGIASSGIDFLPKTRAKIRKITPDGKIYTVAGEGAKLLNDPTSDNTIVMPGGVVIDKDGRLVFADTGLNQIKVLPKGSY